MQFSLKWLLIAIAFIAISLVALINATDLWVVGLRSVAVLTVLVAIIGAVWSVGTRRAFWSGYAFFALAYITSVFGIHWGEVLITSRALAAIHSSVFSPITETDYPPFDSNEFGEISIVTANQQPDGTMLVTYVRPTQDRFVRVGDAILAVVFGLFGGLIATAFYRRRLKHLAQTARPSSAQGAS